MNIFVDTWGWIALADRSDPSHNAATKCYVDLNNRGGIAVTSNFVLDETFTLLFRRRPHHEALTFAASLMKSPFIRIEVITEDRFKRAFDLRVKFADKPSISFTDLSSMTVMTELKLRQILTADNHFLHVGLGFQLLPGHG